MSQNTFLVTGQETDLPIVMPCAVAQPCTDDPTRAYKELIINIAENLTSEDIERVLYQLDLNQNEFKTGMQLLHYLEKRGKIGLLHMSELSEMLKTAHREDLVTKMIKPFRRKYDLSNDHEEKVNPQAPSGKITCMESMLKGNQVSQHKPPVTSPSLHSSTYSLIQQETCDPSLSNYTSASAEMLKNSWSSIPNSMHKYVFTDEPKHYRKSQESSQSELNLTDLSTEITSTEYSNSPIHQPCFTRNPPLGFGSSNSSLASEMLGYGSSGYQSSPDHFTHHPRAHKHLPKSQSFSHPPHSSLSMRKNSVVEKYPPYNYHLLQQITDTDVSQSPLNQQEQLTQPHRLGKLAASNENSLHSGFTTEGSDSLMPQIMQSASRLHDGRSMNERRPNFESISQYSGSEACVSPTTQVSEQPASSITEASSWSALTSVYNGDRLRSKSISSMSRSMSQATSKFSKTVTKTSLTWSINRLKLNKIIYKHEAKSFVCKKKLEIDIGNGASLNPKISLIIHPRGLEKDIEADNATLVIYIKASKKAPPPEESASIILLIKVTESDGECELLNETACEINLNSRVVRKFGIVSHEALKKSESESIDLKVKIAQCD